jgi:hypothetical protein
MPRLTGSVQGQFSRAGRCLTIPSRGQPTGFAGRLPLMSNVRHRPSEGGAMRAEACRVLRGLSVRWRPAHRLSVFSKCRAAVGAVWWRSPSQVSCSPARAEPIQGARCYAIVGRSEKLLSQGAGMKGNAVFKRQPAWSGRPSRSLSNHSIEGMSCRLRRQATPHVKR